MDTDTVLYVTAAVREQRNQYDRFRRATGMNFEDLLKMHKEAVAALDDRNSQVESLISLSPIMAVDCRTVAYFTDQILQQVAMGANLVGHTPGYYSQDPDGKETE